MKIISLNTWGGRAGKEKLLEFFDKNKEDTDIFCLQEIWAAPYTEFEGQNAGGVPIDHEQIMVKGKQEISAVLSNHVGYFRSLLLKNYGLLMLVNKKLKVINEGELYVYKEKGYVSDEDIGNHARFIQYITLLINNEPVTVINFHGLWNGKGKTDTEDRLEQSRKIVEFVDGLDGKVILCGDFNLLPDSESVKIVEQKMRNLIKEYGITSTRSSFYDKPERHADYVFTSSDLEIKDFKVLPDEISDHLPLFLEIS